MNNIFKVMGVGIPNHQMEKPGDYLGASMLQEQLEKYSALLKQLSEEMGIFRDAEQRARAAKLVVASKFTAVERLLNQTQAAVAILSGEEPPAAIPTPAAKVQVVYKEGTQKRFARRGPMDVSQAVQDLGGSARTTEILNRMATNMGCSWTCARNVFYTYKSTVLLSCNGVGDNSSVGWKLKEEYANN